MSVTEPPYLGAAYYPEDWPLEQIDQDIELMKKAGCNVMRIGEFAWSRMEPQEGQYDFEWLHLVMDKLAEASIATILGTPSATPPAWLSERYPEILAVDDQGVRAQHGARRHACPNSPIYREHCARIVTRMAEEVGDHPGLIGWQIDNEMYPFGARGCCCRFCRRKFQERMRTQYGSIEALNAAWGNDLWSQTYQSFSQIPAPRANVWHHPSLLTAWMRFQSDSIAEFSDVQADVIHKLSDRPVGTDMMPTNGLDYERTFHKLDVVQFNHYHDMSNMWSAGFWMDFIRPIKATPFWNTETQTCWNGATTANGYKEPGFCRANSWMPIALGAEANLYWLWRAHWSGQELMHGSVVDSWGRPLHIIDEVKEIAAGFRAAADFLNGTSPDRTGLAVHFSGFAWCLFDFQPMVNGFRYGDRMISGVYDPIVQAQLRPDILPPAASLDGYRLVYSPFLPCLEENGLRERLRAWMEAGGTWICGPMTDCRDLHSAKYRNAPFSVLEDWTGAYCKFQIPGDPRDFAIRTADGVDTKGSVWYDGLEPRGAEVLATYTEGPLKGLAAAIRKPIGRGQIIMLGTHPQAADLQRLLASVGPKAGVKPVADASDNLLVVPRSGDGMRGLVIVETRNRPGTIRLPQEGTDLLTDRKLSGSVEVPPFGVLVVQL